MTEKMGYAHVSGFFVYPREITALDISSTRIREFLANGRSVQVPFAGSGRSLYPPESTLRHEGSRIDRLTPSSSKEKAFLCAQAVLDRKAIDLVILEVKDLSSFTDYFLICSGNSDRQVQAIASHIEEKLAKKGIRPLGMEGKREGRWILLDYGDVIVHVFYQPVREFYDLERLWSEAPRIEMPRAGKGRRKRSGMKKFRLSSSS